MPQATRKPGEHAPTVSPRGAVLSALCSPVGSRVYAEPTATYAISHKSAHRSSRRSHMPAVRSTTCETVVRAHLVSVSPCTLRHLPTSRAVVAPVVHSPGAP